MKKIKPSDMVDGAKKFYDDGYGYIWGASGGIWTRKDQDKVEADPDGREQTKRYGAKWIGKHVIDCSGVPYKIAKDHGISIPHGSNSQYLKTCTNHGRLTKGMDILPGAGVFKYNETYENPYYHVGIYTGDGKLIEAKSTYAGVVISTIDEWFTSKGATEIHYGYWDFVDWGDSDITVSEKKRTLKKGSRGEDVSELQTILTAMGYECGAIDGIFGSKTLAAVKAFQADHNLTKDGIVGSATWGALLNNATESTKLYTAVVRGLSEVQATSIAQTYRNVTLTEEG